MAMTMEALEAEVKLLKEQVNEQNHTKDILAIWKLNSIYSYLINNRGREVPGLFARNTPGLEVEIGDGGVFEGLKGVKKVFEEIWGNPKYMLGGLQIHYHVNPVIEINKEGTQARGIWQSPGLFTGFSKGKIRSFWEMGIYDITYVKEEGEWKFLKFIWRTVFSCRFNKGPAEDPHATTTDFDPEVQPDRPCTYHMPYMPTRINRFEQPKMPEPYED